MRAKDRPKLCDRIKPPSLGGDTSLLGQWRRIEGVADSTCFQRIGKRHISGTYFRVTLSDKAGNAINVGNESFVNVTAKSTQ